MQGCLHNCTRTWHSQCVHYSPCMHVLTSYRVSGPSFSIPDFCKLSSPFTMQSRLFTILIILLLTKLHPSMIRQPFKIKIPPSDRRSTHQVFSKKRHRFPTFIPYCTTLSGLRLHFPAAGFTFWPLNSLSVHSIHFLVALFTSHPPDPSSDHRICFSESWFVPNHRDTWLSYSSLHNQSLTDHPLTCPGSRQENNIPFLGHQTAASSRYRSSSSSGRLLRCLTAQASIVYFPLSYFLPFPMPTEIIYRFSDALQLYLPYNYMLHRSGDLYLAQVALPL